MELYHTKLELRIDWSELDYFGHVNNVSFFKYVQASRVNYWDSIGLTDSHRETQIGPMLASCACQFFKPLFYPGKIVVQVKVDFIRNTSFGFSHQIMNDKNEIAAEAKDVMVLYDFGKNEKVKFPDWLRAQMERVEGRRFIDADGNPI